MQKVGGCPELGKKERALWPSGHRHSATPELLLSSPLFDYFESCEAEGFDGVAQLPVSNQDIICLESADGKNAYIGLCQRHSNRNKAPDKVQVEWANNLKSSPASTHLDSGRDEVILTYH